jgi:hypothetical protein
MKGNRISSSIWRVAVVFSLFIGLLDVKESQASTLSGELDLLYDGCNLGFPRKLPITLTDIPIYGSGYNVQVFLNQAGNQVLPYIYKGQYIGGSVSTNSNEINASSSEGSATTKLFVNKNSKSVWIERYSYSLPPGYTSCYTYYNGINLNLQP